MKTASWIDQAVVTLDGALRTLCPPVARSTARPNPSKGLKNGRMTKQDRQHAIGLMRVNHSGEVCAQALYQSQAMFARDPAVRRQLDEAQAEEIDHLGWCESRLGDLGGRVSILNPLWYVGSILLGAGVGCLGSRTSLGFVVEVEQQVEAHLEKHLQALPKGDVCSRAVVAQMQQDEGLHASAAKRAGGLVFPAVIQGLMKRMASIMTVASYYL